MAFGPKNNITVLIIDDDEDDVDFFMEAVKKVDATINCIGSNDATKALAMLRQPTPQHPDYIFLDLNMPRMNGKQCLREIKKIKNLHQTPVFIYSTSGYEDPVELEKLGATGYFTKPYRFNELLDLVQGVLTHSWQLLLFSPLITSVF